MGRSGVEADVNMTDEATKHHTTYLTWLNQERFRSQRRNIGLLRLLRMPESPIHDVSTVSNSDWFDFAQLMLGANFSYWRAIFLAETSQSQELNIQAMKDFLNPLTFDNGVNFTRDLKSEAWTLGYYMNNCIHRIKATYEVLSRIDSPLLAKLKSRSEDYKLIVEGKDWQTKFDEEGKRMATPCDNRKILDQMSNALDFLFGAMPHWYQPSSKIAVIDE